jgi:hypothetical protein
MSNVESAIIPGVHITPTWRLALAWIGASAVAVPMGVLLHELGHVLFYLAFGFPDVVLHYNSATYSGERTFWQLLNRGNISAAASTLPLWKVGIATVAGLLVTCVATLVCCFFAYRKHPQPLMIALGVFAPVRFLSGIPVLTAWLSGKPVRAGTDEAHLAALTGIPIILLVFAGLLFLALVWIWMVRRIPQDHRWVSFGGLVSGLALGIVLYFWAIGPWLLP